MSQTVPTDFTSVCCGKHEPVHWILPLSEPLKLYCRFRERGFSIGKRRRVARSEVKEIERVLGPRQFKKDQAVAAPEQSLMQFPG